MMFPRGKTPKVKTPNGYTINPCKEQVQLSMQPVGERARTGFRRHLPTVDTGVNTTEVDSKLSDPVDNVPVE